MTTRLNRTTFNRILGAFRVAWNRAGNAFQITHGRPLSFNPYTFANPIFIALRLTYAANYIVYEHYITVLPSTSPSTKLADNPDLITSTTTPTATPTATATPSTSAGQLGWEVGLAYWTVPAAQPNGSTKPTPHEMMFPTASQLMEPIFTKNNGATGFGQTINIINGGVECGSASTVVRVTSLNRINAYIEALLRLGVGVKNVVVTLSGGTTNTFTSSELTANIGSPTMRLYENNSGTEQTSNYTAYEPSYGTHYLTHPLLEEYYVSGTDAITDNPPLYTNITQIMVNYSDGTQERLDCVGYYDYAQVG